MADSKEKKAYLIPQMREYPLNQKTELLQSSLPDVIDVDDET